MSDDRASSVPPKGGVPSQGDNPTGSWTASPMELAQTTIAQIYEKYASLRGKLPAEPPELEKLAGILEKLEQGIIRIAAFGAVSRGKSTVVNALVGQKLLSTSPIHGATTIPTSIRWFPQEEGKIQVELIDTPGLDEVGGTERSQKAKALATQADLILFIVSGDITRAEYQAMVELAAAKKPMLLVFNKTDLHPEKDAAKIYEQLQSFQKNDGSADGDRCDSDSHFFISLENIVMVAAEPMPVTVREQTETGEAKENWETPPPQIEDLKQKILQILNQEGRSLLALNALLQASQLERNLARCTIEAQKNLTKQRVDRIVGIKAVAIALMPVAVIDLIATVFADLNLVRALARQYQLPLTGYQAGKLGQQIFFSLAGVALAEVASILVTAWGNPWGWGNLLAYLGGAIAQATLAGYGSYRVSEFAQEYLATGCTWAPFGTDTIIVQILRQAKPNTLLSQLHPQSRPRN
ncbi:GTP-binding protein [Geitlerinema sp. PCC 9228]|uniref:GTP-binding protein n=1 Tax=Geitlerinema sp. PCC 9228 TaxID=111611 RepID=UPI000A00DAAC|nr:GTP-binding protein [Geitlerinema sp. PCC 9228]